MRWLMMKAFLISSMLLVAPVRVNVHAAAVDVKRACPAKLSLGVSVAPNDARGADAADAAAACTCQCCGCVQDPFGTCATAGYNCVCVVQQ